MTKGEWRIIPKYLYKQAQTAGKPSDPVARCCVPKNFPWTREALGAVAADDTCSSQLCVPFVLLSMTGYPSCTSSSTL